MNRRRLIIDASTALVALSIPGWAQVFGPSASTKNDRQKRPTLLRSEMDAARTSGRPLLVLLGPPAQGIQTDRSRRWSLYLEYGGDRALADLALCEIVCAHQHDFAREFPDAAKDLFMDVMAILIETDVLAFVRIQQTTPVPTSASLEQTDFRKLIDAHNCAVELVLRGVLAPDRATLERRFAQSKRALSKHDAAELSSGLEGKEAPRLAHARLVPSWMQLRALDEPENAAALHALLADRARERWRAASPPGARWENPWVGCGSGPCGTGFARPRSLRFLHFYAESERDAFETADKK